MTRAIVALALVAVTGLFAGLSGCGSRADDDRPTRRVTELPQPGPELSQELMLGLALARNYHHKAEVYLKEARIDDAVTSVRQILSISFPAGSPEGEDVLMDARARLAQLLSARGDLDQAMTIVDEGLAKASRQSFFVANLHTVRGQLLEARATLIEDRDKKAASAARRQAIEAHDRAIAIEKALIGQLAGEEVE
jgi:hypothetical protein